MASGISAAMQEACAGGGAAAVAAVCGSKGTGKSTFGRLLLNSLLNTCSKVAWLDTDCGQPEFTVPGQSSPTAIITFVFRCYAYHLHFAPCELHGYASVWVPL